MHGCQLHSCANCWFNGLQAGSVGISVGYCTEHRVVLRQPDHTTCGRHIRLDLTFDSAQQQSRLHSAVYTCLDGVQRVADGAVVRDGGYIDHRVAALRSDPVGAIVTDYGEYGAKIESLAQLRALGTSRAEFALLSLGRAYVDRCVSRGGRWTSGLHLLWWTRQRLIDHLRPALSAADFRYQSAGSIGRQIELAQWWLVMLRLVFISDIGAHALDEDGTMGELADVAERAAADTQVPSLRKLTAWIRSTGLPLLDRCLPESRYRELAAEVHRE